MFIWSDARPLANMASNTRVSVFIFLFLLFGASYVSALPKMLKKPGCNKTELVKVDKAIARLMPLGPNGRFMPENDAQLKRFCPESRNLTNFVEKFFRKCLSKDMEQTSKLAMYPPKKSVQQFCPKSGSIARKSKRLEKFMKVTPCINKNFHKNDTCVKSFIADLKAITQVVDDEKLKIPHLCCSSVKVLHCIEDMLDSRQCARENKETILDFMGSSSGDFFNIACGEFNESTDRCKQLKPLPKSAPNTKNKRNSEHINYFTPAFLVIELFSTLGEESKV